MMTEGGERATRPESAVQRWLVRSFWLLPLVFYGATVSPTAGWVDAPFVAQVVHRVELSVWVNHHDLFTLLGAAWLRLMPASVDPHYALNLLCAGLATVTVAVVFRIGLALTGNPWASALGASVLMVSHSLWWHATMLEVYTLSTALLATTLLFVVRYDRGRRLADLAWATFFFGLGCSNHPQMGLLGAGFLGLLAFSSVRAAVFRPKALAMVVGCFLAGFSIYLGVFGFELATRVAGSPDATVTEVVARMLHETSGGSFKQHMFPGGLTMRERFFWWGYWLALLVYNFPPPWLLAAPAGLVYAWRHPELRLSFTFLGCVLGAQVIWSSHYMVWDMWAFSLPAYLLVGVLVIVGIAGFARRGQGARLLLIGLSPTVVLTPWLYARAASWASQHEGVMRELDRLPQLAQATAFWEPLDYFLDPNKRGYDRVDRTSRGILEVLDPGACFWGNEATAFYPLSFYYQGVLGLRPDVSYELIFGMTGNRAAYRRHAARMEAQLRRGCPVYISSLVDPDRAVLDEVYARLEPEKAIADVRRLSTQALVDTFPVFMIEPIVIEPDDGTRIYGLRLEPRAFGVGPELEVVEQD